MAILLKKSAGASKIDTGTYHAVVRSVAVETPKTPSAFNPDCEPFLKWMFRVHKPLRDGAEVSEVYEISYITTMRLTAHPKNKLNNFLKAAGVDTEVDELDVETAVGKRVQLYIKDKETDQGTFSQVADVLPAPAKKAAPAPAAPRVAVPAPKAAPKAVAKPVAPPVEEVEEDVAPPAADDDLGDLDEWASLD